MLKRYLAALPVVAAASASYADNCEAVRAQIESKYRAGGVVNFTLSTVDAAASAPGKVVGTCGNGTKRITFSPSAQPGANAPTGSGAPTSVKPSEKPILTECKDGTASYGGNCKK